MLTVNADRDVVERQLGDGELACPSCGAPLPIDPEAWGPWGLQLAGNWTEAGVLAAYERLRRKYVAVLGDRQRDRHAARRPSQRPRRKGMRR